MKTLLTWPYGPLKITQYLLFLLLALLLLGSYKWILVADRTAALVDPGIFQLLLFCMLSFISITGLCWWLLQQYWQQLGFPPVKKLVLQFKNLELWQQLVFFWASFALLLAAGLLTLLAIF